MSKISTYDVVIVGGGHNGLVAACYLALAGMRVLILEKNDYLGGATLSKAIFSGVDARLSVYSYLVSLMPNKIVTDLGIRFQTRRRSIASYTPHPVTGRQPGLLISNVDEVVTRQSFSDFTADEREYAGYRRLQELVEIFAQKIWPTLLLPLVSRQALQENFRTAEERAAWEYMVEKPLACLIEDYLSDDTVRGAVFTDAKIGVPTYPQDPTLLQNRTFLYHTIGQGTGEWRVPVGGMGALVDALENRARSLGVEMQTSSPVIQVEHGSQTVEVHYLHGEQPGSVSTRYLLFNTSSDIANQLLPGACSETQVPGSVFKINLVLKKLPTLKDPRVPGMDAFTGTFHLNEGYQNMQDSYAAAQTGRMIAALPGEMYCHTLTDPSILSPDLQAQGFQTITLFGLDVPYQWFVSDNENTKGDVVRNYLRSMNQYFEEDILDCLAVDANGLPCLDAKSPIDLERSLGLPRGNIFHGNLTWPFAEEAEDAGTWGVETSYPNVYLCGSSAQRGGAVSGIPGHNAAMRVLMG